MGECQNRGTIHCVRVRQNRGRFVCQLVQQKYDNEIHYDFLFTECTRIFQLWSMCGYNGARRCYSLLIHWFHDRNSATVRYINVRSICGWYSGQISQSGTYISKMYTQSLNTSLVSTIDYL